MAGTFTICALLYLLGHHPPAPAYAPIRSIQDPHGIWLYVLTYFGASWTGLLPHKERLIAFVSLIAYLAFVVWALRARDRISNLEWFCLGECTLAAAVAFVTALDVSI
jgi:hypothetical protein